MKSYNGLTGTVNNSEYTNKECIILDTTTCCVQIAVKDNKKYTTKWVLWSEVEIQYPNIETYRIYNADITSNVCRYADGEVYKIKIDNKEIKIGINKSPVLTCYNVTNLETGEVKYKSKNIENCRCKIIKIAKDIAEDIDVCPTAYDDFKARFSKCIVINPSSVVKLYDEFPF